MEVEYREGQAQGGLGASAGLQALAGHAAAGSRLSLHAVELEGFKSYRERVVVGAPFGAFTCVVGPNGCGKSVVGEAIAFALGGNAKMMRARNLGSLVNHAPPDGGGGSAAPAAAAEVVLYFNLVQAAGDASGGNDSGSGSGKAPEPCLPAPESGQEAEGRAAAPDAVAGRLLIRRRVARSGRSSLAVCHIPSAAGAAEPAAVPAEQLPSADRQQPLSDAGGRWHACTPAALRELLAPFGIQTEAVDRFVVTQHRQAVQVQDPAQLAGFLELLIGTAGFAEQLEEVGREVAAQASSYDEVEEAAAGLELRRRQLAPEVAKMARYRQQLQRHRRRKVEVLGQQAALLQLQLASGQQAAGELQGAVAAAAEEQAAAKSAADGLLGRKTAAGKEAKQAERGRVRLAQAAAESRLQAARLKVQLKAAEAAAAGGGGKARAGLQGKLSKAEEEAAEHREELQAIGVSLNEAREDESLAAAQVVQLRGEVDAPGGLAQLSAAVAAAGAEAERAEGRQAAARLQQEQRAAEAVAAETEAAAIRRAQQQRQERQAAAEAEVQRLRTTQLERQPLLAQVQEREAAARQRQYQAAAASQEAQAVLAAARAQLEELERPRPEQGAAAGQAGGRQTFDQAVAALAAASAAGQLPGAFHGRLHSVMRLAPQQGGAGAAGPDVGTAVNAALMETCNLGSTLVVADRPTAQAVVAHFERHRVGVVTCRILSELQPRPGAANAAGQAAAASDGGGGLRPLAACVQAQPGVPGTDALLSQLLHGWWLVPDRQAALAAVQADRRGGGAPGRRSIVTLQGDCFKADGEIAGARTPPQHLRPYLLGPSFAPAGGSAAGHSTAGVQQAQATAEERDALRQELATLQAAAEQAAAAASEATQQAEQAADEAGQLREQQQTSAREAAAAERRLQTMQGGSSRQAAAKQAQRAQQLQRQLSAGRPEQAVAAAALEAADAELAAAGERLAAAQAAYEAGMASSKGGSQLLAAEKKLEAQRALLADLQRRAAAGEAALAAATRQQQQLAAAQRAAETAAAEAARLQQELQGMEVRAGEQEQEAASLAAAGEDKAAEAGRLEAEWRAAVKLHQSATKRCQQAQVSLRELEAAQRAAQHKLTAVQAALAEAAAAEAEDEAQEEAGQRRAGSGAAQREQEAAGAAGSESEGEGGDGADEEGHRQRRRLALRPSASSAAQTPAPPVPLAADADAAASSRQPSGKRAARPFKPGPRSKRPLVESSSEEEAEHPPAAARSAAAAGGSSCSNSDFEAALSSRRPSAAASKRSQGRQQRLGGGRGRGHAARAADAAADEGVAWGEAEVEAAVEELRQEEQELQALRASISDAALAEDAAAESKLAAAAQQLDRLAESLQALDARQGSLQAERYRRFHAALTSVNEKLGGIYAQLTGGQGDAYTEDRLAAFTDGVAFHVRPDRQRWRPFPALSGGQQALATLAVCFALQAAFPSPLYFFDEIDASLDTSNAARVAQYIASQGGRGAQYLVVSHKPQVYERAQCLVGVYSRRGGVSDAVTLHVAGGGGDS